jgi:hypothetical protein
MTRTKIYILAYEYTLIREGSLLDGSVVRSTLLCHLGSQFFAGRKSAEKVWALNRGEKEKEQ